jgi:hypothetical protein
MFSAEKGSMNPNLLMNVNSYRLAARTMGILTRDGDGHRVPVTIPRDAVVASKGNTLDGNKFVAVTWEGKTLMMFAQDLQTRGVLQVASGQ